MATDTMRMNLISGHELLNSKTWLTIKHPWKYQCGNHIVHPFWHRFHDIYDDNVKVGTDEPWIYVKTSQISLKTQLKNERKQCNIECITNGLAMSWTIVWQSLAILVFKIIKSAQCVWKYFKIHVFARWNCGNRISITWWKHHHSTEHRCISHGTKFNNCNWKGDQKTLLNTQILTNLTTLHKSKTPKLEKCTTAKLQNLWFQNLSFQNSSKTSQPKISKTGKL